MSPKNWLAHGSGQAPRLRAGLQRLLVAIAVVELLAFAMIVKSAPWAKVSDFDQLYLAGATWLNGHSPYNADWLPPFPDGPASNKPLANYYYAPSTGLVMAPLALLPFSAATLLWKVAVFALLLYAIWRFLAVACPEIQWAERCAVLGTTALASCVRWNVVQLQPTALIVALSFLFACAVFENRRGTAILLALLISIKVTYLLPIFGLLAFRRHYREGVIIVALIGLLNGASLLRTGPMTTVNGYRAAMSTFDRPGMGGVQDALDFLIPYLNLHPESPLAARAPKGRGEGQWASEQTQMTFALSAWGLGPAAAKAGGVGFNIAVVMFFGWLWLRVPRGLLGDRTFQALLFAALTAASLLVIYHQRYDALSLLPCAFLALAAILRSRSDLLAWAVLGVSVVFCYLLPARVLFLWYDRIVVPRGWLVLAPVSSYACLLLFLGIAAMLLKYWSTVAAAQGVTQSPSRVAAR